ncbi:MAG: zinc-finger domain-containing protein [Pseudomonadota bacterium]|nr:zinc-finger domain-containing protein [Pseudomonadota bacterium]
MEKIPKITNDEGKKRIEISFKKFNCLGASPPHDHPHIYLDMGEKEDIICPYCGTNFEYKA